MEITETLYLSGRMTDQPGFNFAQFDSAEHVLVSQYGYKVISPAQHDRAVIAAAFADGRCQYPRPELVPGFAEGNVTAYEIGAGSVHDLLAWDFLQIIQESDGIAMLPGWEHSSGARAERFVAEAVGKRVYILTEHNGGDWTLASDIEQRRMHDHVSLFAAGATEHPSMLHAVERIMRREIEVAEQWHEDHARSIFAAITDDAPSPTPPIGTHISPPELQVASAPPDYDRRASRSIDGEVRVVDPATGGAKGTKAQAMHLIPGDALLAISEHLNKGAQKYAERNWEKGYAWSLSFAAMQRHLWAWWQGQDDDPEFGWSHLRAVGFHALVLLAFELRGAGTDDRPGAHCQCCGDGSEVPEPR